jgi:hypothetical protein
MKNTLFIAATLLAVSGFAQTTKLFIESSVGSASISSNNSQVTDRYSSPMMRTAIGYDLNNIRVGVSTARSEYGFSTSAYSVSTVGLIGGYNIDFDHFGLSADAIVDYRLASLQRVGGQQITSGSLSPIDFVLRPSVFVRPIKSNQSVELVVGYELGLLDLDPTDAAAGISAKHRALTIGVRALFKEPAKPRKADYTL